DLDMPALEELTYSDDENVDGAEAEADINNLKFSILANFKGRLMKDFLLDTLCSKAFKNQPNSVVGFQDTFNAEKAGEEVTQTYVLFPVWSAGSTNPKNTDKDALVDGKEHDVDIHKSVSDIIHSSSSSAQTRKQADKTERENKGKSLVESFTGFRDLNAEFEECSNNSSNEVNAASSTL
nr:hypothetical protein [Tanacetum cinerariifolium]